MDLGIKGKWALVCAASKGLGKGCALALAGEGVNVVITARGAEALQATAAELRKLAGAGQVIAVRPYTHNDHYWQVYFDTNEAILRIAREAGWPAPTPTQIVRSA